VTVVEGAGVEWLGAFPKMRRKSSFRPFLVAKDDFASSKRVYFVSDPRSTLFGCVSVGKSMVEGRGTVVVVVESSGMVQLLAGRDLPASREMSRPFNRNLHPLSAAEELAVRRVSGGAADSIIKLVSERIHDVALSQRSEFLERVPALALQLVRASNATIDTVTAALKWAGVAGQTPLDYAVTGRFGRALLAGRENLGREDRQVDLSELAVTERRRQFAELLSAEIGIEPNVL
jgi:hypothetical protein